MQDPPSQNLPSLPPAFASFLSNSADLGTKLLLDPSAHLSFSSGVHQMQPPSLLNS